MMVPNQGIGSSEGWPAFRMKQLIKDDAHGINIRSQVKVVRVCSYEVFRAHVGRGSDI